MRPCRTPHPPHANYPRCVRTWVAQYSRARANSARIAMCRVVERLPVREQALALDYAIRKLGPELQAAVSALPHARQEQFIGARRALQKQHDTAHTVDASVDCRLEVPLSFDKLQQCNTFLSRRRRPDGSLDRIVVMPIPSPVHEARKRGIRTPLYAQSPFRPAQQVRDRQAELIEHDDIEVSSDGHALDIELTSLAAECLAAARGQGNLRLPPPPKRLRLQYMFDAYRYMRGKGATRFGIRPMDLKHDLSSLLYWRDACFYSGNDKYSSLLLYCKRAIDTLNAGAEVTLQRDAAGKITGAVQIFSCR